MENIKVLLVLSLVFRYSLLTLSVIKGHSTWNTEVMKFEPTCDFQQCGILTRVDSDEPRQSPFKGRNSKCCSVSSLTVIEC